MSPGHRTRETKSRATTSSGHHLSRAVTILIAAGLVVGVAACDDEPTPPDPDADACIDPLFCPDVDQPDVPDAGGDATEPDLQDLDDEGCELDTDCATGEYCDVGSGACVDGCRTDPDSCVGTCEICLPESHECVLDTTCELYCEGDSDCDDSRYCDIELNLCRTGCRVDAAECPDADLAYCCSDSQFCDAERHRCVESPCANDSECPILQFCFIPTEPDSDPAECRDGCRTDPDNCTTIWRAGPTTECDDALRSCAEIDCAGDDEMCPSGYVCENDLCRVGCRSADDCDEGQPCHETTRLCECDDDDQCDVTAVCDDSVCIDRCVDNDDCRGNTPFCNTDTGRCFGECNDEASEPNDERLVADQVDSASVFGGVICGVDTDWFRLDGNADETIRLTFAFDPGTLDVSIQIGNNDPIATGSLTSETGDDQLVIDAEITADERVYVDVSGEGVTDDETGSRLLGYVAQIDRFSTGACEPDRLEDDDDLDNATALVEPGLDSLNICAVDPGDFFSLALPADERAAVTLTYDDTEGSLDLVLFDDTRLEVDRSTTGNGTEVLGLGPFADATDWYLGVVGTQSGVDEAGYGLALDLSSVTACVPDDAEPNDDDADATPSLAVVDAPSTIGDLTACSGNSDWFSVNGLESGSISARIVQASGLRTLLIEIIPPSLGAALETIENNELDRTITASELVSTGTYYVRVEDVGGDSSIDGIDYSATFEVLPPPCVDPFEPNDDTVAAKIIIDDTLGTSFDDSTLKACRSDTDYFKVEMIRSGALTISLTAASYADSLQLDLLDETEAVLASGILQSDGETLTIDGWLLEAGTYYINVDQIGYLPIAGQGYRLQADATLDAVECVDDGSEPNDSPDNAVLIGLGVADEHVCPGDEDYWLVNLPGPSELTMNYAFDETTPGVLIQLFEPTAEGPGSPIRSFFALPSGSVTESFELGAEALIGFGDNDTGDLPAAGGIYDFDLIITCLNDGYEPNDDLVDAEVVALDELDALDEPIACPGDVDRFESGVTAGTISVTLHHGGSSLSFDVSRLVEGALVPLDLEIEPDIGSTTLTGTIDADGVIVTTIGGAASRTGYSLEATQTSE